MPPKNGRHSHLVTDALMTMKTELMEKREKGRNGGGMRKTKNHGCRSVFGPVLQSAVGDEEEEDVTEGGLLSHARGVASLK